MKALPVIGKESNQTRAKNDNFCFFISLNIWEMKSDQAKRHLTLRGFDVVESGSVSVAI